jgi:hypothetical protein
MMDLDDEKKYLDASEKGSMMKRMKKNISELGYI